MPKDWDRINEALLSAAQGKTPTPVVSRRSLFGIPSAVELKMQAIVAEVARGAEDPAAREKAQKLREKLDVAADALGGRLTVGRASCYFVFRARSAGYDIPADPFAGSGELKEFLHDQGVASVPEWYEGLGIGTSDFVALDAHALVSFQHEAGKFRVALSTVSRSSTIRGFVRLQALHALLTPDIRRSSRSPARSTSCSTWVLAAGRQGRHMRRTNSREAY